MYYEFYIDVFFLENMLMDYGLLLLTAHLLKWRPKLLRLLLAGGAGSLGACIMALLSIKNSLLWGMGNAALGILMIWLGFPGKGKRQVLRGTVCLYGTTFVTGGIFQMAAGGSHSVFVWAAGLSLAGTGIFWNIWQSQQYKTQNLYQVTLEMDGKRKALTGLRDTGNQLKEPVTGKPVSIAAYEEIKELLNKDVKLCMIPYHSIGKSHGVMPGIVIDAISIQREHEIQNIERPMIAVSKEPVSKKGSYQIILHPSLVDD